VLQKDIMTKQDYPSKVFGFSGFVLLMEGGAAIKSSRRILESEFPKTLEHIQKILFPILGIDPRKGGDQYIVIGSIGKKKSPDDTSGDLDIGFDSSWFSRSNGIPTKEVADLVYKKLKDELPNQLGFDPEMNFLKGLGIVSVGWPIEGDPNKGIVQLDLIPISSMDWASFIYYSPNYKIGESKYKSAHRNWLLSAILSVRKKIIETDAGGEILDYETPVLVLSDGLFWHTKSFRGKIKPRLANAQKIAGSEKFVTRDPQEFLDFVLGPGYSLEEVKTFEDLLKIIESPDFELKEKLPEIKEKFLEFLNRAKLEVPSEINRISTI
jgi:hypothetical protein